MLTGRQSKILEILLNNVQGVTSTKLSEYLDVSSRTIRSEVGRINKVWEGGEIIFASKKKGYYILEQQMNSVREYLRSDHLEHPEVNTEDRGWMLLGITLQTGRADIYEIGELLFLSEAAVYKEVSKLKRKLWSGYQVELLHISGEQLWIEPDEKKIRQTLFKLIKRETEKGSNLHSYYLKLLLYDSFEQKEYELFIKLVKEYFDSRQIQISDANLYMTASALYVTAIRNFLHYRVVDMGTEESFSPELQSFFEYLNEHALNLNLSDQQILGKLFHNFKLTANPTEDSVVANTSRLIMEEFCQDVMDKYHFDLWHSAEFYQNLLIHIEYMIRRMETGYEVKSPILNEIKKQYPYACEISMLMVPIVYRYKNCFIRDDEVSYIAVFMEHFLQNINQKLKAVIISSSRFSVSTIVNNWIQMNFQNQIEVTATLPLHKLDSYLKEQEADLVISTEEMVIYPNISTFRITGIPNQYTKKSMDALIYKTRMNYRFREIIKEHFDTQTIRIYRHQAEFEKVIRDLAEALHAIGSINDVDEYVSDVIQREVNYPTNIGDSFMIPHPLVTFARKTAIAAAVLKKPLRIQEKEVQVIFLLAMEPKQDDQIGSLFHFFKQMAMERSSVRKLSEVEKEEEFIEELIQISNSVENC